MRRFVVPVVIAGSAAVLVALVMLWRSIMTQSEAAPPPTAPAPAPTTSVPSAAPVAAAPVTPSRPAVRTTQRPTVQPEASSVTPSQIPTIDTEAAPGTRANKKNLDWGLTQMRELVKENEPLVNECLSQAAGRGVTPSGDATLTFIVAQQGDKFVIETTGVDHDATTLKGDSLLECLHATSSAMKFAGLPREAKAVFVTRAVTVENGQLVANKMVKFSYLR